MVKDKSLSNYFSLAFATFGVGYLPLAPGTWGGNCGCFDLSRLCINYQKHNFSTILIIFDYRNITVSLLSFGLYRFSKCRGDIGR